MEKYKSAFKESLENIDFSDLLSELQMIKKIKIMEFSGKYFWNNPRLVFINCEVEINNNNISIWPEDKNAIVIKKSDIKSIDFDESNETIFIKSKNDDLIMLILS